MRYAICLAVLTVLSLQASAPAAGPTAMMLSTPRVGALKATKFISASVETTYADMGPIIGSLSVDIITAMAAGGEMPAGGPVFIYKGASISDPAKSFTLEVGYPVSDNAKPLAGYQLRTLDPLKSEMSLFMGTSSQIRQAYAKLYAKIMGDGKTPSDERREHYLYWEGVDSPNNVILIEIGLQDQANPNP